MGTTLEATPENAILLQEPQRTADEPEDRIAPSALNWDLMDDDTAYASPAALASCGRAVGHLRSGSALPSPCCPLGPLSDTG